MIQPTPSQYASAACHLDRQGDWRTVRIDGERYVVMTSATSARTYILRADGAACQCVYYQRTGRQCAHLLALELAVTLRELAEDEQRPSGSPLPTADDIWPACAAGCGDLVDRRGQSCDRCCAERTYAERIGGKVLAGSR